MRLRLAVACALASAACKPCVDFGPGRPFQCSQPGATDQCPGAWRCGIDHVCFDPAVGAALPCDPAAPADAGECPNGWRCGLAGDCHAVGDAAPYLCRSDNDCEGGWRCDIVGGHCLDASDAGLLPGAYYGAVSGARISPLPYLRGPTAVASTSFYRPCLVCDFEQQEAAVATDGGVVQIDLVPMPATGVGVFRLLTVAPTPWPRPVLALAQARYFTYLLDSQGGWTIDLTDGGVTQLWSSHGESQLRLGGTAGSELVAFGGTSYSGVSNAFTNPVPFTGGSLPPFDGGAEAVLDVAIASTNTGGVLLAAGPAGAFETPWSPTGAAAWVALNANSYYNNFECPGLTSQVQPVAFFPLEFGPDGESPFTGFLAQGPTNLVVTLQFNPPLPAQPGNCSNGPLPLAADEVNPSCPPGYVQRVVDWSSALSPPADGDAGAFAILCQATPDAGPPTDLYVVGPQGGEYGEWSPLPSTPSTYFSDVAVRENDRGGFRAAVGRHGQLWLPAAISDGPQSLWLDVPAESLGTNGSAPEVAAQGSLYVLTSLGLQVESVADAGYAAVFFQGQRSLLLSVVGSSPQFDQGLVFDRSVDGGAVVATIDGQLLPLRPPFHALAAPLPDGGIELVVTAFNVIYAGPPGGPLPIKTSLPTELPITSIELHAGNPDELDGFVVASDGVRTLQALDEQRWVLTPLDVPPGPWLSVWTDGNRERLGYGNGAIYALPGRVPIAPPFPVPATLGLAGCGALAASDFQDLCGQPYALTNCGVLRLFPADAGTLGVWQSEPNLFAAGFEDGDLAGATMEILGNTLTVTSRFGETVQLTAQCH